MCLFQLKSCSRCNWVKIEIEYLNIFVTFMFPKFYYKLLCFDKNIIGQIGVQGINKYLNLPYTHPQLHILVMVTSIGVFKTLVVTREFGKSWPKKVIFSGDFQFSICIILSFFDVQFTIPTVYSISIEHKDRSSF